MSYTRTNKANEMNLQLPGSVREMPEYQQGRDDWERGCTDDECPHGGGDKRTAWFSGWFDMDVDSRIGRILQKFGLRPHYE